MRKTIRISDDVYYMLKRMKGSLSFSKFCHELVKANKKEDIMKFAGAWDDEFAEKRKK